MFTKDRWNLLNIQWHPRRQPSAITTTLTRSSLCYCITFCFTNMTTPVSRPRPQSSCYKTANRTPRDTTIIFYWYPSVVHGYGNFAVLIQYETFSWIPYPIHIRKFKNYGLRCPIQIWNRSLIYALAKHSLLGSVYFASWGKSMGILWSFCR